MRRLTRGVTVVAAIGLLATVAPESLAVADDSGGKLVVLSPILRNCAHENRHYTEPTGSGTADALISATGNTVTATVNLATAERDMRYEVKLVQMPRAASAPCNAGDPGVAAGALHTDFAGAGHVTLTGDRVPDATGAWVEIIRPSLYSQMPAEFYTSDIVSRF